MVWGQSGKAVDSWDRRKEEGELEFSRARAATMDGISLAVVRLIRAVLDQLIVDRPIDNESQIIMFNNTYASRRCCRPRDAIRVKLSSMHSFRINRALHQHRRRQAHQPHSTHHRLPLSSIHVRLHFTCIIPAHIIPCCLLSITPCMFGQTLVVFLLPESQTPFAPAPTAPSFYLFIRASRPSIKTIPDSFPSSISSSHLPSSLSSTLHFDQHRFL